MECIVPEPRIRTRGRIGGTLALLKTRNRVFIRSPERRSLPVHSANKINGLQQRRCNPFVFVERRALTVPSKLRRECRVRTVAAIQRSSRASTPDFIDGRRRQRRRRGRCVWRCGLPRRAQARRGTRPALAVRCVQENARSSTARTHGCACSRKFKAAAAANVVAIADLSAALLQAARRQRPNEFCAADGKHAAITVGQTKGWLVLSMHIAQVQLYCDNRPAAQAAKP